MEEKTKAAESLDTAHGHLSVHVEGSHPPEIRFSIEQQSKRLGWSFLATMGFYASVILVVIVIGRLHIRTAALPAPDIDTDKIVWIAEPGPGGGGGGGGDRRPDPPKPVELKGKEKITVPVAPAMVAPKVTPDPIQQLDIPAQLLAAAMQDLPGAISAPGPLTSMGSGSGGGAGTGTGGGIGSGNGSGLAQDPAAAPAVASIRSAAASRHRWTSSSRSRTTPLRRCAPGFNRCLSNASSSRAAYARTFKS